MLRFPALRRHRIAATAALCALAASGLLVATPAASAEYVVGCPTDNVEVRFQFPGTFHLLAPTVLGVQSTFNQSDGREVVNGLDYPIQATFTSQVSRTFTIQASASISTETLLNFFKATVSVQITKSTTTQIGVNAQMAVPPFSRVVGLYGTEAYWVTYVVNDYKVVSGGCVWLRNTVETRNAPTIVEGWRFATTPMGLMAA
jgi:hypothetical protein